MTKLNKQHKRQSISCNFSVESLADIVRSRSGEAWLAPNTTYHMLIDYPLSVDYMAKIKVGNVAMGLHGLLIEISKAYSHVYKNEADFGIWGHIVSDLILEGIKINHEKKLVTLLIGS